MLGNENSEGVVKGENVEDEEDDDETMADAET